MAISVNDPGVYTKTGAYNFLKDLLNVPRKNVFISKEFFSMFFKKIDSFYLIKSSEELVSSIFSEEGLVELNRHYFLIKKEHPEEALEMKNDIFQKIKDKLKVA